MNHPISGMIRLRTRHMSFARLVEGHIRYESCTLMHKKLDHTRMTS